MSLNLLNSVKTFRKNSLKSYFHHLNLMISGSRVDSWRLFLQQNETDSEKKGELYTTKISKMSVSIFGNALKNIFVMFTLEYCFCRWKFPNYAFSMKGQGFDQTDCVVGVFTWDFRNAETCWFFVIGLSLCINIKDEQE